jgi:CubicO group peptidase (beta-lactamase class C family)
MEYSNYGFILLGRLIEIVSRESYEDYIQKHIFALAGMTHTDSRPESDHVPGRAIGYTKGPGGLQPNTAGLPWSGTSAGGGYSTVGDLLLFANALESGKLIDPALLRQATTDQTHGRYGFGFYVFAGGVSITASSTSNCSSHVDKRRKSLGMVVKRRRSGFESGVRASITTTIRTFL